MEPIAGINLTPFPAGQNAVLFGNAGNDTITGDTGNDLLFGRAGADRLAGGSGNDTVSGGRGSDTILGADGNDSLIGDRDNDLLNGGNGNDTLTGVSLTFTRESGAETAGNGEIDTLTGGAGADLFVLAARIPTFVSTSTGVTRPELEYSFYNDNTGGLGLNDYALITDFNLAQDNIQLLRSATYLVGALPSGITAPSNFPTGAILFLDNDGVAGITANDEVIAVFQGLGVGDSAAIAARFILI
ncbi:MAG: calcium-binding protein [Pseudanabaenaceae cyanobacterium bins.68]|nr:calcium-binding protein [Pseudanabaenaceae cyanobacterium bins.68]